MKISILAGLLLLSSILSAQPSLHCIPLNESRVIHDRALKSVYLDSAVNALEGKMIVLEENSARRDNSFQSLLSEHKGKNKILGEMLDHQKSLTESYKDENGALRKQVKREKRKTKAAGIIGLVVIVIALL